MEQCAIWKEGTRHQWILYTTDNSPIDILQEKVDINQVAFSDNDAPINLGIKRINGRYYSGNYVGLCRLQGIDGKRLASYDGREIILRIEPRFNLSVVDMLAIIHDDDEFERYLAPQTTRIGDLEKGVEDLIENELFYFFDHEDPIYAENNVAMSSSIISASVYISLLKDLCRRPLMGRMVRKEQNLVGKVKGKVLFQKNIRNNTLRGREDRIYCQYLQYSEDILENQTLKCALQKAELFLKRYFSGVASKKNSYREMISYCQNALSHVSLIKIDRHSLSKNKTTGCYAYYKPVINAARMIINEITLEASGKTTLTSYIIPYAISMSKLFEMYTRSVIKKAGIKTYEADDCDGISIMPYDYKSKVLVSKGSNYSGYIRGNIKPDIIIYDAKSDKYVVFDVKYKSVHGGRSARADRLQVLAYALMYNCENVGIIFPSFDSDVSCYYDKNEIQTVDNKQRYFNQLELVISESSQELLVHAGSTNSLTIRNYVESLLY